MYYINEIANFTEEEQDPRKRLGKKILKGVVNKIKKIPNLQTQVSDIAKENAGRVARRIAKKNKPTFRQKVKGAKAYMKYRKFLGDRYGRKKGMEILGSQKTYLKNLVNPSYKQKG